MKLFRRGSERDHGPDVILTDRDDSFTWNKQDRKLTARRDRVSIGTQTAHHNYHLELSLADFVSMLDEVVDKAYRTSREELCELLSKRMEKIQLLMMCATGYPAPECLYSDDEEGGD